MFFTIKIKNWIRLQTLITSIFLITILGSSKKLDLEEEIDLESDMNVGDLDDELSLDEGLSGSQVLQSTSKRVRMIFSVMGRQTLSCNY